MANRPNPQAVQAFFDAATLWVIENADKRADCRELLEKAGVDVSPLCPVGHLPQIPLCGYLEENGEVNKVMA